MDHAGEFFVPLNHQPGQSGVGDIDMLGRGQHVGDAVGDQFTLLVGQGAVEDDNAGFALGRNRDGDRQIVPDMDALVEVQRLAAVFGPGAGQGVAEDGGNLRADPHAGSDRVGIGVPIVIPVMGQRQGIEIAGCVGKNHKIVRRADPVDRRGVADRDLVESPVPCHGVPEVASAVESAGRLR